MQQSMTTFTYNLLDKTFTIEIAIPFHLSIEELTHIFILNNNLPVYVETDLLHNLRQWIIENNSKYYNESSNKLIDESKDNQNIIDDTAKEWEKIMKDEMNEFGEKHCVSDEELFATAYHKMVHSPALETMLQLEYMYSKTMWQKSDEKDRTIQKLSQRQSDEMNQAVDRLEQDMTELKINELVAKHYETHSMLKVKLTSELDTIKEAQRREYREWLMQMLEQSQATNSLPSPSNNGSSSPLTPVPSESTLNQMNLSGGNINSSDNNHSVVLEESFTIHLGSQLKQMHNIRILSANFMALLCAVENNEQLSQPTPQLLQTALALYSNDLYGLVLMTDNKIGSRLTHEFQEVCERTTDFHFLYIDDQLDKISNTVHSYLKSQPTDKCARNLNSELLQPGDFYITKHSNLAQAHVIFHMVSDDSLRGSDINSRHQVVLGLRHILKTACAYDVTSLTIPLLLQYDMTEDMTISWCEKRAELVFKCVKGFMIEMASWGGSDLKNLQFMLPQGISTQVFQSLTEMLPKIFKVSNPKILI